MLLNYRENNMKKLYRTLILMAVTAMISIALSGCTEDNSSDPSDKTPSLKMGILADPHYYDPSLGTSSADFQAALAGDRKMFSESKAIMESVAGQISAGDSEILLVAGDLTKDGCKFNHEKVAAYLAQIESSGKKVFVCPGNHDISNPHSYSYPDGAAKKSEPNVSPAEFELIYADFGFNEAIARDPNSLSYIAEPKKGIWIISIDACNYDNKFAGMSRTGGKLAHATIDWINDKLDEAAQKDKKVFAFAHHGVVEHFPNMGLVYGDYLLADWKNITMQFARRGLNVIFTGHHHATDISHYAEGDDFMFDVQTGSSVTWVCPYRTADYNAEANTISIENHPIESISYNTGGKDFPTYAHDFLADGIPPLVIYTLMGMGLDEESAKQIEPIVTPTMLAYYHGDEAAMQQQQIFDQLNQMAQSGDQNQAMLAGLLLGIWNDDTPDNNVIIDLNNGTIASK
jgi:3',5'-cyclic AMP phosphodiesterase CpdA